LAFSAIFRQCAARARKYSGEVAIELLLLFKRQLMVGANKTGKPLVLALSAYLPTVWNLKAIPAHA